MKTKTIIHNQLDRLILHLSLIEGIGPATIAKLITDTTAAKSRDLYQMSPQDIVMQYGLPFKYAQSIAQGLADHNVLDRLENTIQKKSISWISLANPLYPELLRHIYAPPPILYWYGMLPDTKHSIAVVGSRKANDYGKKVIDLLLTPVIKSGGIVISGGALGIDTLAHRKSVELEKPTTIILGSGLLNWYPHANKNLFEKVIQTGGCIISPFAPETPPHAGNFPARNRIISGLSRITVVVQAAQKSGALITAQYALDQGRDVMAVPGNIDDPLSHGCNSLILQGATAVFSASPLLEALDLPSDNLDQTTNNSIFTSTTRQENCIPLSTQDKIILLCKNPRSLDELMHESMVNEADLIPLLFDLHIVGKIKQDIAGRWLSVE